MKVNVVAVLVAVVFALCGLCGAGHAQGISRSDSFFHKDLKPTGQRLELMLRMYSYSVAFAQSQHTGKSIIVCVDQTNATISKELKRSQTEGKLFAVVKPSDTVPPLKPGVHELAAQPSRRKQ